MTNLKLRIARKEVIATNICSLDEHAIFLRNVVISNVPEIFTDSFYLCYDSDAVFLTNEITCSIAESSISRNFNHGLRVYLTGIGHILPPTNDKKTGASVYFTLAYGGDISINEYPTHVRVSESQFAGLNVEILFSLAITRKPYRVQRVGGSYVKATRASS